MTHSMFYKYVKKKLNTYEHKNNGQFYGFPLLNAGHIFYV
jgi:hypothetical protein